MQDGKTIRLLLSSRNPTLREGIKKLLRDEESIRLRGETSSVRQTVKEALRLHPDVILMDADMAGAATLAAIRQIKREIPRVSIWVCSLWEDADLIAACLEAGASGSVPADADSAHLLEILHRREPGRRHGRNLMTRVATWLILAVLSFAAAGSAQTSPSVSAQGQSQAQPQAQPQMQEEPQEEQDSSEADSQDQDVVLEPQQQPTAPPPRFGFTTPLSLSAVRETRLPVEQRKIDDWIGHVAFPEMTLADVTARSEFYLSYHPTFEIFGTHKDLNNVAHSGRLRFARELAPRWVIGFRDSFLSTEDPTRALRENVFLLPRTPFWENFLSVNLDYLRDSRTKYSLDFDNTVSFLSLRNLHHIQPSDSFDQVAGAITASVTHKLEVQERVIGTYSFLLFRNLHTGQEESVRRAHHANVTYEYGWENRGIFMEVSAGVLHGSSTSYTTLGRVGFNWRNFSIASGYSRQFAFVRSLSGIDTALSGGLSADTIAQAVTLDLTGTVGGALVIDFGASAGKGDTSLSTGEVRSLTGRARIAYRVGRVFPFVGAEFYGQNFNPMTLSRMNRSRYMAGVSIALDSVVETVNTPTGDYQAKWPLTAPGLTPRRTTRLEKGELR